MKDKGNYFDSIGVATEGKARGVVYLNDLSVCSNFIFMDWGVPVIRPNSLECANKIADIMIGNSLSPAFPNLYLDALSKALVESLTFLNARNQEMFCLIVSFNQKQMNSFDLHFSKKANPKIVEPIERNFRSSNQNFNSFYSCTNTLFQRIEEALSLVTCLELRFGKSIENSVGADYTKEKVFEETIIFATLAIRKMV